MARMARIEENPIREIREIRGQFSSQMNFGTPSKK
jgi:hypothetical protein